MYKTIKLEEGQTLPDIALQEYGCYEGVFILMDDNEIELDDLISAGMEIKIREEIPALTDTNLKMAGKFAEQKLTVNSGIVYKPEGYASGDYFLEDYNEQ